MPVLRRPVPPGLPDVARTRRLDPTFPLFGEATMQNNTTAVLITTPSRPGFLGFTFAFANEIEPPHDALWSSATGTSGVFFTIKIGGAGVDGLGIINSPWGFIGDAQPLHLPVPSAQVLTVEATNKSGVTVSVCTQLKYILGPASEGVG